MKPYHQMDKETLDLAYDCTKTVSSFPDFFKVLQQRSKITYQKFSFQGNISYGKAARNTFDFFPANTPNAPTLIFIHGGYWQSCEKEDFSYIAEGPLKKGFNVILLEYTIAPEASMTRIMEEINLCLDYLAENVERFNIQKGKVCLCGHSAGGHLTLAHKDHPLVSHALPLSALVDLEPISLSFLNDALSLTQQEIEDYSPIRHVKKGVPVTLFVGGNELPELIRHSQEYYDAIKACQEDAILVKSKAHDHFSLLEELDENGEIMLALTTLMQK